MSRMKVEEEIALLILQTERTKKGNIINKGDFYNLDVSTISSRNTT